MKSRSELETKLIFGEPGHYLALNVPLCDFAQNRRQLEV
jgi:hypothetical protein